MPELSAEPSRRNPRLTRPAGSHFGSEKRNKLPRPPISASKSATSSPRNLPRGRPPCSFQRNLRRRFPPRLRGQEKAARLLPAPLHPTPRTACRTRHAPPAPFPFHENLQPAVRQAPFS